MNGNGDRTSQDAGSQVSRRRFLQASRNVAVGTVFGSALSGVLWLDDAVAAIPASEGYLLVDTKKCQGCVSCMLACSLVHEGVENLSLARIQVIQNSFEKWGGGHGMGSAIFFDPVKDKTIDGFDPANVVTLMTSPFCGTLVPAAGGRTEVQGIGVQSSPIGWFTRSNFGGRFSSQLKFAGWDGIVIEGKADEPVWIDIRNGKVHIRDCEDLSLWGKDTWECQKRIWGYVAGNDSFGDWLQPEGRDGGRTTQRPAVLALGF